jgi:predicted membrane-bound spermidine synthase
MPQNKVGKRFELHYYHIVGLLSVVAAVWTFWLVRSQPKDENLLRTLLASLRSPPGSAGVAVAV